MKVLRCKPRELRVLQSRDRAEDARLLAMLQLGLEADHVPKRAERVVLAQLHHRVRATPRARVTKTHGLHRSEAQCFRAAFRHHFDGQATLEIGCGFFPFLKFGLLARDQRRDERFVLFLVHRAVDVIGTVTLVVTRLHPRHVHVDGFMMRYGRDGIEERERLFAG
jgi:hypothetical protein